VILRQQLHHIDIRRQRAPQSGQTASPRTSNSVASPVTGRTRCLGFMIRFLRTMMHTRQSIGGRLMRRLLVIFARLSISSGIDPIKHLSGAGA